MLPVKGIKLMIISVLLASLLMPFTVSADDYTGSTIQGFNVSLIDVEQVLVQSGGTSGYMGKYIYEVEFILDDSYVGYINISGEIKFYPYNSSTLTTYNLPGRNYFVNGNSFKLTFQLTGDGYTADNRPSLNNTVFTYGNHNLYKYSEIDSLETIINLLNDLYNNTDSVEGLLNDQLDQLELIVDAIGLSNQYLETITKIRQFNIPFESFTFAYYLLSQNYDITSFYDVNYYNYPVFYLPVGSSLYKVYGTTASVQSSYDLFLIISKNIGSNVQLNTYLEINDGNISFIKRINRFYIGNISYSLLHIKIDGFTTDGDKIITVKSNSYIMPICAYRSVENNFSTDFALQFGLTNDLLDYLNIIANGTTQSNAASSDLENNTSDFDTAANQYYTIENTYNNNMNTQLQNIDTSTGLSGFGGNFLTSANWVRVQFNNLTNGNPFGSLVTYGLTLGLALLLLGKVFL